MLKTTVIIVLSVANLCISFPAKMHRKGSVLDDVAEICGKTREIRNKERFSGRHAISTKRPWVAYIEQISTPGPVEDGQYYYICSGSLINSQYVLTAAHCIINPESPKIYRIVLGEHIVSSISGRERKFEVEEIIRHKDFQLRTFINDIALMKLAEPTEFSSHILPICLPELGFPTDANTQVLYQGKKVTNAGRLCTVSGWVRTDVLQERNVVIIPRILCTAVTSNNMRIYRSTIQDDDSRFCAGGSAGNMTCQGEGGGPLACKDESGRYFLNGISSAGPFPCGQAKLPDVFTEVAKYRGWIETNVKDKAKEVSATSEATMP